MMAYSFLVYTCMALAMTATAIAMKRDMAIDFGNVTHPPDIPVPGKRNTTTENFHTNIATAAGKDILELDNDTVSGSPIEQTTKMAVTENDDDVNALLQEMKQLKKNMEQIKALVHAVKAKVTEKKMAEEKMAEKKMAEEKTTKDKLEKKENARNIRAHKDWSFDYPHIHELDAKSGSTPSILEPTTPYNGFDKFGFRLHLLSHMYGRLKRNHHGKSQKHHHPTTETYVASKDESGASANANEYDGKILPHIYTSPMPPIAMESEALGNYNNDNARLPASTQDAAPNDEEMVRNQRKDNEDPYKLSFDMEANDKPSGSSFSNHVQELNADEQKLNDMLETSTENTLDVKTDATPAKFEPTSAMPYNGFGKVGFGRRPHLLPYMFLRRMRNRLGRSQKHHSPTDTYVASKDNSGTSANANENDGKILPHIYTAPHLKMKPIPPIAMESGALDNYLYNNDNARSPASTQNAPRNVDERMRDQRKDNEDPFKLSLDMEANDKPKGSIYSNHAQELNADEQKLNDMLETTTENTLEANIHVTPSMFEPTSAMPYHGFDKVGYGRRPHLLSYMFGRRKRNHRGRSQKHRPTTETYVASKDESGASVNANEYDGKILPHIYTSPIPPIAMKSEAVGNYNNANASLPGSTQDAAPNDELMRDQRKDNADPYKLSFDMEANDMSSGSSFSNHVQELIADEQKLNDMLEEGTKNTVFHTIYDHPRHLPKSHLTRKMPERKRTQIHGFVPGSFSMTIDSMPKDKEPLSTEKAMSPIAYKLRNEPQKERTSAMKDDTVAMKDRIGAFKSNAIDDIGLGEVQSGWLRALPEVHLYGNEAAKYGLEKGINPDGESQLDGNNMGLESEKINQEKFDVTNDKRDSAALEGPATKTEVKSFTFPLKKMPRFFTDPDMEPSKIGPILANKSLKTIIKCEPGENEEKELEVVCPIHGGDKGDAEYGKGMFCTCHVRTKPKYSRKPKELIQK